MGKAIRGYDYETQAGATTLLVFLHGWTRKARDWDQARAEARKHPRAADHLVPDLAIGPFATHRLAAIGTQLVALISEITSRKAYEEIILVGHSCGAVLAREVWVRAQGVGHDCRPGPVAPWADRVSRIVLLAALNRGYNAEAPASLKMHALYWLSSLLEPAMFVGPRLTALDLRRGSPFLTSLRLGWMAALKQPGVRTPLVVQILGTGDDIVAPSDNIDLATGLPFFYIEAAQSDHLNVLDFDKADPKHRREPFMAALYGDKAALRKVAMSPRRVLDLHDEARDDLDADDSKHPEVTLKPCDEVRQVVFVIHGIRDYGYWTKKLAARIKQIARHAGIPCRSVTSTYGYFPMGPFLTRTARRRRVEWLLDQYVTAKALYPNAEFHFVGHSNGTYLFAGALNACPAITFERAVLAGSVIPSGFAWRKYFDSRQLGGLVNYVATNDWVVASIPRVLQWLGFVDKALRLKEPGLGSGGHDGFRLRDENYPAYTEVHYAKGAHSAALNAEHWDDIGHFTVNGTRLPTPKERLRQTLLSRMAWLGAPLAVLILVGPLVWLLLQLSKLPGAQGPAILGDRLAWLTGLTIQLSRLPGAPDAGQILLFGLLLALGFWLWLINRVLTRV